MFGAIVFSLAALTAAASAYPSTSNNIPYSTNQDASFDAGLKLLFRTFEDCQQREMFSCLKMKAITFFDRAVRKDSIELSDSIALVKSGNDVPTGRALTENELETSLPQDANQREYELESLLLDRVAKFMRTHTIQFKLPDFSPRELQRNIEEGRGKMKKLMMPLMMGMLMKVGTMIPLAFGTLFLLAGKALLVSKLALLLSVIIGLKKLFGNKGSGHDMVAYAAPSHGGWSGGGSGGYDRSLKSATEEDAAHHMAYRGQVKSWNSKNE